jgi:acetyl-CoA/propionyl-CoA carboxylase biotin carboxyl carrier protein
MIAKLIVHDSNRERARRRMLRALEEFVIEGPATLLGFHRALLEHPCFAAGETCHGIVESPELAARAAELTATSPAATAPWNGRVPALTTPRVVGVEVDGRAYEVTLRVPEPAWAELGRRRRDRAARGGVGGFGDIVSPMQGTVLAVEVVDGDSVEAGQVICIVEAMKMENEIAAPRAGVVGALAVEVGQAVTIGQRLCTVGPDE